MLIKWNIYLALRGHIGRILNRYYAAAERLHEIQEFRRPEELDSIYRYEWLAFGFTEDDIQYLKSKKPVVYVFGASGLGYQTVALLQKEGIEIKSVLATRQKKGVDNILGAPIVTLDELREVEPNSICLVALSDTFNKMEVYPLLSPIGFGNVVPVYF